MRAQLRRRALLGILSMLLTQGCTALRPVQTAGGEPAGAQVRIGDQIRVVDGEGRRTEFEVTEIGADYLVGETRDEESVRFAFAELREIERRESAPGRTVALVGIGIWTLLGVGIAELDLAGWPAP